MKLRNKKTGEIIDIYKGEITLHYNQGRETIHFKHLEDLEEWEDYEEPKDFWFIDSDGEARETTYLSNNDKSSLRNFGNYFETKEEAEKAVEKLKAWKRLKDKGVRFNRWTIPEEPKTPHIKLVIEAEMDVPDSPYDLDLLFGGEE